MITVEITKEQLESLKQISGLIVEERYHNLFEGEDGGKLDEELNEDLDNVINSAKEIPFIHKKIKRVEDGFRFIRTLEEKGLSFHFDDGAEVLYELNLITWEQKNIINKRLDELFNPLFNWGEYEDAFGYALFILKEKENN